MLLSDYDPFQELRKDALDFIPFRILRGLSDRVALSVRAVHHCGGYVPEPGDYQFFRSHGVARQPVAGFDYDCDPVHPGPDTGDDLHCP